MIFVRAVWPEVLFYLAWFFVAWVGGFLGERLSGGRAPWAQALPFATRFFIFALCLWQGLRYLQWVTL